jgi:hypothetical protein
MLFVMSTKFSTDKNNAFSIHFILPGSSETLLSYSHGKLNYTCVGVSIGTCSKHTNTCITDCSILSTLVRGGKI